MNIDINMINSVKGFLDHDEGLALYECAKDAGKMGPCLEIGSYCGKSALYLGAGCKAVGGVLFSVDHHRGSEEQQPGEEYFDPETYDIASGAMDTFPLFRETLLRAGLEETVVPIVCKSDVAARMWATPLSLVFIDGGHSEESAGTDYDAWSGHLVSGGFLLIHDIFKNPEEGGQAPYNLYRKALSSGLFAQYSMTGTLGALKRL